MLISLLRNSPLTCGNAIFAPTCPLEVGEEVGNWEDSFDILMI
jgi:hypothetical protein